MGVLGYNTFGVGIGVGVGVDVGIGVDVGVGDGVTDPSNGEHRALENDLTNARMTAWATSASPRRRHGRHPQALQHACKLVLKPARIHSEARRGKRRALRCASSVD